MACFLFHPRVVSLTALTSIRSKFCSNLIPKYGVTRAIVTKAKDNSQLQFTRWPASVQVRLLSSKASGRSRTFKVFKYLCLAGGFVFWSCVTVTFTLYATGRLQLGLEKTPFISPQMATVFQLDPKDLAEGGNVMEEKSEEMRQKESAIKAAWAKLKSEEAFRRKFGENVEVSGYKYNIHVTEPTRAGTSDDPELLAEEKHRNNVHVNKDKWKVCLFVDGSKSSGLVTMVFHKINTEFQDDLNWIPVSLLVETLPSTGVKLCDISAPLPNGITKFTRLFNDD
ncbi:uncharacterized protein LOC144645423 [Oculina patagonica]